MCGDPLRPNRRSQCRQRRQHGPSRSHRGMFSVTVSYNVLSVTVWYGMLPAVRVWFGIVSGIWCDIISAVWYGMLPSVWYGTTSCMLRYVISFVLVRYAISCLVRYAISCLVQYAISWMVRYAISCMVLYGISYCMSLWCDSVIQSCYSTYEYCIHVTFLSHDLMSCHFFILAMLCLAVVLFSYCYFYTSNSVSSVTLTHTFLGCLEFVYLFSPYIAERLIGEEALPIVYIDILMCALHEDANGRFLFSAVFVFVLKQRIGVSSVCGIGLYQGISN